MYYVNKTVSSGESPQELEVAPTAVYVRKDVKEVSEEVEGKERTYYRYKESKYDKDEYIELLTEASDSLGETVTIEKLKNTQKSRAIDSLGETVAELKFDILMLMKGGEA